MAEIKEEPCGLSREVTLAVLPRLYMEEVVTELRRRNISTDTGATGNCRERLLGILQDVMEQEYHREDTGASSDLDVLQMPHVGTTPGSSPQNSTTVISLPSRVPGGTSHVQATTSVPCSLLDLEEEDFGIEGREQTQRATEKHSDDDDDDGMAAAAVPVSVTVSENVSWSVSSKTAETARTISERETHCGLNAQHAHSCSLKQEPIDQNRDGTSENMIDRCQHCSCSSRRSPAFPTVMAEDLLASFGNALEQGQSENMVFVVHELVKQVAENRRAIQELRDQQQQRLEEPSVSGGQEELEEENGSRRKRRKTKHKLPDKCRDNVRKIYKALLEGDNDFNGFNFNETLTSRYNQRVLQTLHSEITREYGGEQRCPFSPMEVKDAAKRYYRSQKDDRVRRDKGRLTAHRNAMRKEQRLTQKVHRRRRALEKCQHSWTDRTKKMAAEILAKQFQSSESSGDESQDPPRFTVRRLPWESEALRRLKDSLDEVCPQRGAARVLSTDLSDRTVPDGTPAWAVKGVYQGDLDEGMSDSLED